MNTRIVGLGLVVAVFGMVVLGGAVASTIYADSPWGHGWCGDDYRGYGMMAHRRGWTSGAWDELCPLLDDSEGSLSGDPPRIGSQPLNLGQVESEVRDFLADQDANLELAEVMEFSNHFYAEAAERDTGIGAYELLIDRFTGKVYPEMGPNMMWNEKYGMMGGGRHGMMGSWWRDSDLDPAKMTVSPQEASELAQDYLAQYDPDLTADDDVTTFYGYYTLHTLKDGQIEGMMSINGYTGRVWYHNWHGDFVRMTGDHHDVAPGNNEAKAHTADQPRDKAIGDTDISADELAAMLKGTDILLINVHVPYEGEIRGTGLLVPYDETEKNLDLLPANKDAAIVLYCRSGGMSIAAAGELVERGYSNVHNLEGGMNDRSDAGYDLLRIAR